MSQGQPLIIQIQKEALDNKAGLAGAMLKAKLACAKLGLTEFGAWVEGELGGYPGATVLSDLPGYRRVRGSPQAWNHFTGWQNIQFSDEDMAEALSMIPLITPLSTLEHQLSAADNSGAFVSTFSVNQEVMLRKLVAGGQQFRITFDTSLAHIVLDNVRRILLDWTIELEKQGILGDNYLFSNDDKKDAQSATAAVINNYNINQVGALVQHSHGAKITGTVNAGVDLAAVADLVGQIRLQVGALPPAVWEETEPHLDEVDAELKGKKRPEVIRKALSAVVNVCKKAASNVAATGIVHAIGAALDAV